MSTPTIPEQIAAIDALLNTDPLYSYNIEPSLRGCLLATLAMLTRLRDAEQNDIEKGRAIAAAMNKPNRT